jgi:alcohol dehydrogenase
MDEHMERSKTVIPKFYEFICPVKIVSGRKALSNLPYEITQLGARKPLVVTDRGVMAAGLMKHLESAFSDSDRQIGALFEDTPVDSSDRVINEVARLYRASRCDALIALGGGSVIDTVKGVNIVISENTDDLLKYMGVDRLTAHMQPMVAIPTTAGTGSEVTNVAVIRNEGAGAKMAFMSNKLYPHVAILDPAMTMTMPPRITAATGMDALTHAVEAIYGLQKNPVSDAFGAAAIRLIRDFLIKAVENGDDEEARLAMANAALLAGMSFSNSMVGMVHALAHACGGVAHVPHGVANSIILPLGMEYNIAKVPWSVAEVAEHLGASVEGLDMHERGRKAVAMVRDLTSRLNDLCGLPLRLRDAKVTEDQLAKIARAAINDGALTYNPEEMTYDDALSVLKKAY